MKIVIQGQDYSTALDAASPLTIERALNKPTVCKFRLGLHSAGLLQVPARGQSIRVTGDDGTSYFTGYVAVDPVAEYAGLGVDGPHYRIEIEAASDECLLDQAGTLTTKGATGEAAGSLMSTLIERSGATGVVMNEPNLSATIATFREAPGSSWSTIAGEIAGQSRAAYRIVDGQLALVGVPAAVHLLTESDGSFDPASLHLAPAIRRTSANDMTVCGEVEPAAHVIEHFVGDGVTTQFNLSAAPYSLPAFERTIIHELFNQADIDARVWSVLGNERYFAIGAEGLLMQGGDGLDGDTMLSWIDPIEMGGTLLLEATGIKLATGSTGMLAGFWGGIQAQAACIAGFQVTAQQGTGAVCVGAMADGLPLGTTYPINPSNQYALRLRIHCNEIQRKLSVYRSCNDAGAVSCGGQTNAAAGRLQLEIQEFVNGVAGMPVTLYDGAMASLPAVGVVVAASSTNLHGSMRGLNLTNLGSAWVTCTPSNGSAFTRRIGSAAQAAECNVNSSGRLEFYTGYAPAAGEQIVVSYRATGRAVGRQVNSGNQRALREAGLPPVSVWIGSVASPTARSSQDCRNAAQVLVAAASSTSALWRGTYEATNLELASDVWPGDALQIDAPTAGLDAQLIVRSVKIRYAASVPDLLNYTVSFANEWAEDLAIKTSTAVPADTWLPAISGATPLPNLNALTVTSISGNAVTIQTGMTAPAGGGFEVRRRDYAFNPGEDTDLVMRGSQPTMTFTRSSASERYYVRMFDGATPPNYSEFSTVLIFNMPVGS